MTGQEIRDMTTEEMRNRVEQLKEEQFRLRFRSATVQLENPILLRTIRRDIARIRTVLRERELAGESAR
jgi:large subunit ribosomal protein L29